jgi:hypothetical protein
MTEFDNAQVKKVSDFLQEYMKRNSISSMTADQCATILAENSILRNDVGPKPGFNFRQLLRDGRDGLIDLVDGAHQERAKTKWTIYKT